MINAGMAAYAKFDADVDEPEALIFAILYEAERAKKGMLSTSDNRPL